MKPIKKLSFYIISLLLSEMNEWFLTLFQLEHQQTAHATALAARLRRLSAAFISQIMIY